MPGSQQRDAKFRSLRKKAFLTGLASQSLDRSCERHQATTTVLYVATSRNIYFLPAIRTNTKYLFEKKMPLMFVQLHAVLS